MSVSIQPGSGPKGNQRSHFLSHPSFHLGVWKMSSPTLSIEIHTCNHDRLWNISQRDVAEPWSEAVPSIGMGWAAVLRGPAVSARNLV